MMMAYPVRPSVTLYNILTALVINFEAIGKPCVRPSELGSVLYNFIVKIKPNAP